MVWNTSERAYFFGPECTTATGGEGTDIDQSESADQAFAQQYCSKRTLEILLQQNVSFATVRCVLSRIAEIVPNGDHSSPGWSSESLPLIVVANAHLQLRKGHWTLVCKSPRFGICVQERHLHIWADEQDVQNFGGFGSKPRRDGIWVPWNNKLLRYVEPVDCSCGALLDQQHPLAHGQGLMNFLTYMAEQLARAPISPARRLLKDVLEPCRTGLNEPDGFDVIYPRLTAAVGDTEDQSEFSAKGRERDGGPSENDDNIFGSSLKKVTEIQSEGELASCPNAESMLKVLRQVALNRVRTVIHAFEDADLDEWIMSTGYVGATAPHQELADLLCVYAASLANSGGVKPQPENFGALIREAIRPFLGLTAIDNIPNRRQLAESCVAHLGAYPLGGNFANDITLMANGLTARVLMTRLLDSVLCFLRWLCDSYAGSAANFHDSLAQGPHGSPGADVFPLLRSLEEMPWMGVATAANFVKDSQMPGLLALDPRRVAQTIAGWFAKPDLHVARQMAYLTGRCERRNLQQLTLSAALAYFRDPPAQNYQGHYDDLIPTDGQDKKVIADIHEWAQDVQTSALEIDRVLYLIGVRRTVVQGIVVDAPWYQTFVREVDAAILRGVPRKS